MSDIALLSAAETRLRSVFNDPEGRFVGAQPGGQPPPAMGQYYVGLDSAGYRNNDARGLSLDEVYDLLVVVTFKYAVAPADRRGLKMQAASEIRDTALRVRAALHMDYGVLNAANALIGAAASGFVEPLRFRSASAASAKGADWVWAEDAAQPPTVFAAELRFGGARRVQTIESQT